MHPIAIIVLFFMVLAAFIGAATLAQCKRVRVLFAVTSLGWAGLMFMAAGWAESLNYNIWYSGAALEMLEAYIAGIEGGRQEAVVREMKKMTNELHVSYEQRGNFRELAERAAESLTTDSVERGGPTNGNQPLRAATNRTSSAAVSGR